MGLTESFMMIPAASVSGFYFSHPEREVLRDRQNRRRISSADYAARRGESAELAEKAIQGEPGMSGGKARLLPVITGLFVGVLILSNILAAKMVRLGPFVFDGGTLLFPLSYIFGDVLTEVYGYRESRKVIWTGLATLVLMSLNIWFIGGLALRPELDASAILRRYPRHGAAHRAGERHRLLRGRVLQLGRPLADEAAHEGQVALDAHDRLDPRRRAGRHPPLRDRRLRRDPTRLRCSSR